LPGETCRTSMATGGERGKTKKGGEKAKLPTSNKRASSSAGVQRTQRGKRGKAHVAIHHLGRRIRNDREEGKTQSTKRRVFEVRFENCNPKKPSQLVKGRLKAHPRRNVNGAST